MEIVDTPEGTVRLEACYRLDTDDFENVIQKAYANRKELKKWGVTLNNSCSSQEDDQIWFELNLNDFGLFRTEVVLNVSGDNYVVISNYYGPETELPTVEKMKHVAEIGHNFFMNACRSFLK